MWLQFLFFFFFFSFFERESFVCFLLQILVADCWYRKPNESGHGRIRAKHTIWSQARILSHCMFTSLCLGGVSTKWSWMNQEGNRRHMLGDPVCSCGYPAQASEHFSLCCPLCNNIRNHTINETDANERNASTFLLGSDQLHSEINTKLAANYELVLVTACPRHFVSEVARTKWSWMNFGDSNLYRRHLFGGDRVCSCGSHCYWNSTVGPCDATGVQYG